MNLTLEQPQPQGTLESAAERLMQAAEPSEPTSEETREETVSESDSETTIEESAAEDTTEAASDEQPDESETVEDAPEKADSETETVSEDLVELNEWLQEANDRYDDLLIPTKINGEEGRVPLSEMVKSYQISESVEQRADEFKAKKAEYEDQIRQNQQLQAEKLEHAEQLSQQAEQFFTKQFEGIDWDDLRETDPAEYSARKQEMTEVQQGLMQFRQNIGQQRQQMMNEQFHQVIEREAQMLPEAIPDWKDAEVAKTEKTALRDYLLSSGLQPQEVDGVRDPYGNILSVGVVDHRFISIARKAMLYDQGQKKVEATKKRVRNVPKMVKPGKKESVETVSKAKDKAKRDRLRKSGKLEDAASLIFDSIRS